MSRVLWGRPSKDPAAHLKDTTLTQFAPDVLAGLYLPLFMFNGRHTVEYDAREGMFLIRLETAFRNRLAPGQFPYPFWHDEAKWGTYQGANSILLWIDAKTEDQDRAVHRRAATPLIVAAPPAAVDGAAVDRRRGPHQPQVTLFDGLFRADKLTCRARRRHRSLALRMRDAHATPAMCPTIPTR